MTHEIETRDMPLMTADQVAALLQVPTDGVYRISKAVPGFPAPLKMGARTQRWRRAEVLAFLAGSTK